VLVLAGCTVDSGSFAVWMDAQRGQVFSQRRNGGRPCDTTDDPHVISQRCCTANARARSSATALQYAR
jgi:hypothetical protein